MTSTNDTTRRPWNLGRLIGPEPPFKPKHIGRFALACSTRAAVSRGVASQGRRMTRPGLSERPVSAYTAVGGNFNTAATSSRNSSGVCNRAAASTPAGLTCPSYPVVKMKGRP